MNEYQSIQENLLIDRGKLVKLYQDGIVDSEGNTRNFNIKIISIFWII